MDHDLTSKAGAIISRDYRYLLWRNWVPNNERRLLWVMFNPSTADAEHDDPTLASCRRMSEHQGYGGLEAVNMFAYRTPYPSELRKVDDPVGHDNDRYIVEALERATAVVAAWGWRGAYHGRDAYVRQLLNMHARGSVYCLGRTLNGSPCHPLYRPARNPFEEFR